LRAQLILWFTSGVALESLYLIRRNPGWLRLACCIGLGLLVAAFGDDKGNADPDDAHYAFAYIAYAGLFGFLFRKDILPVVSEGLLLALTVLFWYGFAASFYLGAADQQVMMALALIPSSLTAYIAFARPALGFWLKLFLYAWFLTIVVVLGVIQFPYGNLQIFTVHRVPWLNAADALTTGMALMYLVVNGLYLYLLIPIPGKHQSFADRMKEWHELTDLLTQRCAEDEPTRVQSPLIVGIIGALAIGNYFLKLVPVSLLISVTLIACGYLLHVGTTSAVLASTAAARESVAGRSTHSVTRAARKRAKSEGIV
jgi:hypothetical protein